VNAVITSTIGTVMLVMLCLAAFMAALGYMLDKARELRYAVVRADIDLAVRRLGRTISSQASWFSADPVTEAALEELGKQLHDSSGFSIDSVRRHAYLKKKEKP
jgi:hypothetical protein